MSSSLTSAQRKELKDAFDVFDTDESGKISQNELGNILKALNIKINDNQLKQLVVDMDSDQSGEIEFDEFCRVMSEAFFKKYTNNELRVAFQQFDQDGSGYIQANELESIMRKMGRRFSKSQIDNMVKSLDSSGDGKISFDEFVQLFQ
ncbi:unnamed protein product [Adineta ricciae]|uniref:EF-hand domain-containing protein n=1 Tax=Adineta ricciae TaxID=249248 RepID=A0A814HD99_ADIRI|nr:unnamed protein product [Adineta ricciae]CAF1213763.1 unnamed protein product [Adineta ricciae]